jgi:uncharacterized protein YjgD (DUF1641 family)
MSEHQQPDLPEPVAETIDENPEALADSLETLARLQESGTLDDLAGFADLAALATAAMDDEMVMELSKTGSRLGELADTAAEDDVARGLESTLAAVGDAQAAEPEPVGLVGLLRAVRDPEVQAGLGFLVALAGALGDGAADDGSS